MKFLICLIVGFVAINSCTKHVYRVYGASFPMIIAHRGGQLEMPENTLYAFKKAIELGVDGIELDVQLSKDSVPVLYHPSDLNIRTNGEGVISSFSVSALRQFNAGYRFTLDQVVFPYRNMQQIDLHIPTLEEAFKCIPKHLFIIIDLKSLPAKPLVDAVFEVVDANHEWDRVLFYSTSDEHTAILTKESRAIVFEPRNQTRSHLLQLMLNADCVRSSIYYPWVGFELRRTMTLVEKLQLGQGSTEVDIHRLWNKKSMQCIKGEAKSKSKVALFGINTEEDYRLALELGADAIYTDCPERMMKIRGQGKKRVIR